MCLFELGVCSAFSHCLGECSREGTFGPLYLLLVLAFTCGLLVRMRCVVLLCCCCFCCWHMQVQACTHLHPG